MNDDGLADVPPADGPLSARETRRLQGRALRKACPRSSHGDVILGQAQRDPLALIEESSHDRIPHLAPIRFTRMAESPFAFFRGTAALQAHDLQGTPSAGIVVQCCGDCHLMNLGGFASPERELIFDINDFDETHPGPFEWDVKRLATSFVLACRWLGFDDSDAERAVLWAVEMYRTTMAEFAEKSVLETWYSQVTFANLLERSSDNPEIHRIIKTRLKKAQQNTAEHVFEKITTTVNGEPQIVAEPPLVYRLPHHDHLMNDVIRPFFNRYRTTLPTERRVLFDRYRVVDVAVKVVGVGSVGTRCYIVLLMGNQDDPLFLQVKEARQSVLAGRAGPVTTAHNGERVVTGQRLMQSASDIFLGWTTGPEGREFYVRQLRDMKVSPDVTDHTPRLTAGLGRLCGHTLARAHAKAGDATMISGYLGSSDRFDRGIAAYAFAYADQVEKDYDEFRVAIRRGRFPIETMPSPLEEAIR